jgi:hypothetical protein
MSDVPAMLAGWYSDPHGRAVQRYWNGASWTPYVIDSGGQQRTEQESPAAQPGAPSASADGHGIVIQNIVQQPPTPMVGNLVGSLNGPAKSTGLAVVLTVLFGPLGLFYASVVGGAVLTAITVVTLGVGIFLTWPAAIVWSIIAVNSHNRAIAASMQSFQPIYSNPQYPGQQIAPPLSSPMPPTMSYPGQQVAAPPPPPLPPSTSNPG